MNKIDLVLINCVPWRIGIHLCWFWIKNYHHLRFLWIFPELKPLSLFLYSLTSFCNVGSTTIEILKKVEYLSLFFTKHWNDFFMNQQNHAVSSLESPFGSRDHTNYKHSRQCQGSQTSMARLPLSPVLKLCKTSCLLPPGKGWWWFHGTSFPQQQLLSCDSKPGSLLSASCREGSPVPQRQGDRVLGAEKVEKTHRKIIHTPPHRSTLNPFMHVSIQTTYKSTI